MVFGLCSCVCLCVRKRDTQLRNIFVPHFHITIIIPSKCISLADLYTQYEILLYSIQRESIATKYCNIRLKKKEVYIIRPKKKNSQISKQRNLKKTLYTHFDGIVVAGRFADYMYIPGGGRGEFRTHYTQHYTTHKHSHTTHIYAALRAAQHIAFLLTKQLRTTDITQHRQSVPLRERRRRRRIRNVFFQRARIRIFVGYYSEYNRMWAYPGLYDLAYDLHV